MGEVKLSHAKADLKMTIRSLAMIALVLSLLIIPPMLIIRFVFTGSFLGPPGAMYMERSLQRNRGSLDIVVEYLMNSGFVMANIRSDTASNEGSITMFADGRSNVISDEDTVTAIRSLFRRGYRGIFMNESVIKFQRWSNVSAIRGIAFSINRDVPDESAFDFLIDLVPLSENDWFFWVENFNEWRRNQ